MIKVGSVVILSRPWDGNENYRNHIGIVQARKISDHDHLLLCDVRFEFHLIPLQHHVITVYEHRLDLIKE
jgi:hypothetical protein